MPINLNDLEKASEDAAETAAQQTDADLSTQIASLTKLSKEEIEALFPSAGEQKDFHSLMQIVGASTSRNEKVAAIAANAEKFGGVILTLLGKFA